MGVKRAKKKCCKDKPRCKTCPVVLKRLSDEGFARRIDVTSYEFVDKPPKKAMAAARAR